MTSKPLIDDRSALVPMHLLITMMREQTREILRTTGRGRVQMIKDTLSLEAVHNVVYSTRDNPNNSVLGFLLVWPDAQAKTMGLLEFNYPEVHNPAFLEII